MTTPAAPPVRVGRGLDPLIVVAAVLALGCGAAAWYTMNSGPPVAASNAPVEALNSIALDAQGAAAGDEAALAGFQKELETLRTAAARRP